MIMRRILTALTVVALLVVSACGDDGSGAAEPAATVTVTVTPEPEAPPPEATTPGAEPSPEAAPQPAPTRARTHRTPWPTTDVSQPFTGSGPPVPTLLAIRTGAHPGGGFDRVALEFDALPGYQAGYAPQIVYDGSGDPVDLDGAAFIQLVLHPAQAHDDVGRSTLASPPVKPVDVDYEALRSYVLNGDFEGYVSVALGVSGRDGFRVATLQQPDGNYVVYIDVAHS